LAIGNENLRRRSESQTVNSGRESVLGVTRPIENPAARAGQIVGDM
jgi:hypothetical protein